MATGTESYLKWVEQAHDGAIKLPAFQRDFKWTRKQVIALYDSLRRGYPIGSLIALEGTKKELKERSFRGAVKDAGGKTTKRLILDGQQRLTAGIDLFYGDSEESQSQYFIDLDKLLKLLESSDINIEDDAAVAEFLSELDHDEGYCVGRISRKEPFNLLNSKHLLWTSLLRVDNSKWRDHYLELYEIRYPERKPLIRNVIKPHFVIASGPDVPYVSIESTLQLDAISRIFSTLNSTGQVLTPFELVVAVLFSDEIDIRDDLKIIKAAYPKIKNMDKSGEITLQTVVSLGGGNPKKSLLPKELKAAVWNNRKDEAAELLSKVGEFLTDNFGMALDKTDNLIPYDSIFMPMAIVFKEVGYSSLGPGEKAKVNPCLTRWIVGSALSQRYQEGVHNKQVGDATDVINWIKQGSDEYMPVWLRDVTIPSLTSVSTKGAIANLLRCLVNQEKLIDPITSEPVNFGLAGTAAHHIFPKKFVEKLVGWDESKGDRVDLFLNLMQLTAATNGRFLNDDPSLQIVDALANLPDVEVVQRYERQAIPQTAFEVLRKPIKGRSDFVDFLKLRETYFEGCLAKWGFTKITHEVVEDENEMG
ncbi:GmrSD restriction endonuclease domain-containing protein [Aquisediminimonas profunda]|uniref:GmrSD restriction endonuclease domain-containing protein n=1 Tax=Aquisediminimonas profunda TaxID=1550733 RepID=UPI001C63AE93|nr:DUF262 domain-containing protein [Aquisediminimonas profunda]